MMVNWDEELPKCGKCKKYLFALFWCLNKGGNTAQRHFFLRESLIIQPRGLEISNRATLSKLVCRLPGVLKTFTRGLKGQKYFQNNSLTLLRVTSSKKNKKQRQSLSF